MNKGCWIILIDVIAAFGLGVLVGFDTSRDAVANCRLPIETRQVSLRPAEKSGPEQPAQKVGGGGSSHLLTPPPTDIPLKIVPARRDGLQIFFAAIRRVESGGDDRAVGDGGRSRGPLQCGRFAWQDACEYGGVNWNYDTYAWSRSHSKQIFIWYCARYGATTPETMSRCWNSGPKWRDKYDLTDAYWQKVHAALAER